MKLETYRDANDEYRWRLRHQNGNIMATGAEGYANRKDRDDAILSVSAAFAEPLEIVALDE